MSELLRAGQLLKAKREEKGFTTIDISRELCLRVPIIEALENGDLTELPHPVYVRGYLKEYANYLGISSEVMPHIMAKAEETPQVIQIPPEISKKGHVRPYRHFRLPPKLLLGSGLTALALAVLITYWGLHGTSDNPTMGTQSHVSAISERSNQNTGVLPVAETKRLMITCHERTWISVLIDGQEKREFMLSPQEIVVLNAKDRFELLVGNAGGVKLIMNGRDVEFTGKSGEVKRIRVS